MDPAKRWYFLVTPDGGGYSVETATRGVGVQGALNTRDLGGYRTSNGRTVKYGEVFRSDSFGKATDAGVAKLAGLGLDAVYDFRVTGEIGSNGPNRLPAGVDSRSVPLSEAAVCWRRWWRRSPAATRSSSRRMLGDGKAHEVHGGREPGQLRERPGQARPVRGGAEGGRGR
ncbi:tyrosine-protein phosphatase [Yinghuangia aomiensis]